MKISHCSFSRLYDLGFSSCIDCAQHCACSVHCRQVLGCIFWYNRAMIEQIHVGNAAICTESVDFRRILRFHKFAKTDMLTPKDLQIILHQWSNKYSFWYLQSSQSMKVGGQVFQSRLLWIWLPMRIHVYQWEKIIAHQRTWWPIRAWRPIRGHDEQSEDMMKSLVFESCHICCARQQSLSRVAASVLCAHVLIILILLWLQFNRSLFYYPNK